VKQKRQEVTFKRPYLIHKDGRVIWSQSKGYQDTAGMVMYAQLVLNPWKLKHGYRKLAVIWDSCRAHSVECVKRAYADLGIFVEALPVNMTDKLQPVDGVACGPLKAGQRALRANQLYEYHQQWVEQVTAFQEKHPAAAIPQYIQPLPTLLSCILMHHSIFADNFSTPAFQAAIQAVFINVGLSPQLDSGKYVIYTSHEDKIRLRSNHVFKRLGAVYHVPNPEPQQFSPVDLFEDFIVGREALKRLGEGDPFDYDHEELEDTEEGPKQAGGSASNDGGGGSGPSETSLLLN
jgi:hypothetical protein